MRRWAVVGMPAVSVSNTPWMLAGLERRSPPLQMNRRLKLTEGWDAGKKGENLKVVLVSGLGSR